MSARWAMHPGRRDGELVNIVTEEDGTEVGLVWNAENATLASAAPGLLAAARLAVAWAEQVPAPYRDWPHVAAARAAIASAEPERVPETIPAGECPF